MKEDEVIIFLQKLIQDEINLTHSDGKIVIKSNNKVSEELIHTIKCNKASILVYLQHQDKYSISSKYVVQFNRGHSNKYIFQLPGFMSLPTGLEYLMQSLTDYQTFGFTFNPEMDFIEYVTETILSITNIDSTIILTGICIGNLLAFEVCKSLENRCRKVSCLLMLTPPKGEMPRNQSIEKIEEVLDNVIKYVPETKKFHEDNSSFRANNSVPFLLYINQLYFNKAIKAKIINCYTSDYKIFLDQGYWENISDSSYQTVQIEGNHVSFYDKENMEINIPRIKAALES
jgi:thioesterase domain-containing protein